MTSATAATTPRRDRPPYLLTHEPDGRSWTSRENLADILRREILGPADGNDEVIEVAPDVRYLLGRIAPVKLTDEPGDDGDPDVTEGVGDLDPGEGRGVPAVGEEPQSADGGEDTVEDEPQKRGLMIPASMGLRFQVPLDLESVDVTATWGVYHPAKSERTTSAGRRIPTYRRTHVERTVPLILTGLAKRDTVTIPLVDEVALKIDGHRDTETGRLLVELALCNDRETPRKIPVHAWMFQTGLRVTAGGRDVFLPVTDLLTDTRTEPEDELRRLNLQYRDRLEFAIGRTCSADWTAALGARRATAVGTTWLPSAEIPQTEAREIPDVVLDMRRLAAAETEELRAWLTPIVTGYSRWLRTQGAEAATLPGHLRTDGEEAVAEAGQVRDQLADGLDFLLGDAEALRCFRFMNRVMADQRVQTQIADLRATQPRLRRNDALQHVLAKGAQRAHSWRTFQIAFVLLQIRSLMQPELERRSGDLARVELLFFPTGGGKTEAYLGLAAYAFAARRRQSLLAGPGASVDGRSGVTVLMRYTLRLLTSQQFQRATAMVCAAELARRDDEATWGTEPFRIGLWVGTDVSPKRFEEADEQLRKAGEGLAHRLTVRQIQRCPWCGTRIEARNLRAIAAERRVHVFCGDQRAECPFAEGGAVTEGLPVLTVDEEIYRLAPAFVIATVDKFARLAREGEAASLFGYVRRRCERHGYVHEDSTSCTIKDGSKHQAADGLPAASVRAVQRLRPPDLIIQDELHLITGALGTTVGLFEIAIDAMSTWTAAAGATVRPVIVASTATVRNAADQIRSLYGRDTTMFPPQVLAAGHTFFSEEVPITPERPGRRYLGLSTTGVRLTAAEIRVAEVLMAAAQLLLDRSGASADPYLTMVGYFSSVRELAGMTRFLGDDVQTALAKGRPWTGLPRRTGTDFGNLNVAELTARVSSGDITGTLDKMKAEFDPSLDSTEAKEQRRAAAGSPRTPKLTRETNPYDAILATAMLQVGVDVERLGLMLMVGQPKNTAEYIQASSRVGRQGDRPGLVVTLGNWARPRDLAHYEQFRHYHETFYARVEALSVTPFSATSVERGLDAVLVSAARVLDAARPGGMSPEKSAGRVQQENDLLDGIIDALVARAARAADDEQAAEGVRLRLVNRLHTWQKHRQLEIAKGRTLVYERVSDPSAQAPLMIGAENARFRVGVTDQPPFVVANSLREVQPEINLLVTPKEEHLFVIEPPGTRRWEMPTVEEGAR